MLLFDGHFRRAGFGTIAFLLLMGCESTFRGEPLENRSGKSNTFSETILDRALAQSNVDSALGSQSTEDDGQLILARMAEIDLLYHDYEVELLTESQRSGLGFSLAGILTSAAGTVASGSAAQNLALASTLAQSGRTAFQKEVLAERTINALISQMRANRAQVKGAIYQKLGTKRYTVIAALSDLELYQQAGTLPSALVELGETVAEVLKVSEAKAQSAEQNFLRISNVEFQQSAALTNADLDGDFTKRKTALSAAVRDGSISAQKVRAFFDQEFTDPELAGDVAAFVSVLKTREASTDPDVLAALDAAVRAKLSIMIDAANVAQFSEIASKLE